MGYFGGSCMDAGRDGRIRPGPRHRGLPRAGAASLGLSSRQDCSLFAAYIMECEPSELQRTLFFPLILVWFFAMIFG